jgi:hypothetical protein
MANRAHQTGAVLKEIAAFIAAKPTGFQAATDHPSASAAMIPRMEDHSMSFLGWVP